MATALDEVQRDDQLDLDMDMLHILPLSIIPLDATSLKRARLIKNSQLDSVIELYRDPSAGSLQVEAKELPKMYKWGPTDHVEDRRIISSLAELTSYDVYCLRIDLRRLGIEVNEQAQLQLSKAKREELTDYMRRFTSPLIKQIYGGDEMNITNFDEILGLFSNPDKESALKNIKVMSDKLEIDMGAVPEFLEEYGDIFLSLAFYRQCLDELIPQITAFIEVMDDFNQSYQMRHDKSLMATCGYLRDNLNDVTARITGRFESFEKHSEAMWDDLSASSFRKVRKLIESHHSTVGGVLCGLSLKMKVWDEAVGGGRYGPVQRAEFVMSHMRSGMDRIKQIEDSAPSIAKV
jgi:hypothetical protein